MPEIPTNRGEMPFLDHLEELRWRILYSLLAIVLATLVGWFIVERVDVISVLKRPIAPLLPDGRLAFTSPTEPFFITLKFAFVLGLVLASPVVIYQAWAFFVPALYPREKRLIVPALSVGALLFLGGAAVGYFWVLPRALQVLFSFQRNDLAPVITAGNYFSFAAQIIVAFGIVTELPLVIVILSALGLVTPQFLARNRRYAIVLSAVAAALLTPPDAVSMLMMMIPLWLLYEVSIGCAWVVTKRRARRERAASAAGAVLLLLAAAGRLEAQGLPQGADTTPARVDTSVAQGRTLDTATARRLGLPTGPTRHFPAGDGVMDSLRKLEGYRVTEYMADTLLVVGGDSQTVYLRGEAFVDREGTKLESDSIRYRQASCRLDATGDPRLFDQGTVLVGEGMRYDTCLKRGTVTQALTNFQQGGAAWYMRGNLAVDSGSTRLYGAKSEITSDDHPVPDYHFSTGEVKWLNKNVMVARPAVLYVRDVPILWLPFIFQDIRPGRRSGILVPRFGLNDLVRPTRNTQRQVANLGYYFVINDYLDLLVSGDWLAGRYLSAEGQVRYRWLDRFVSGSLGYTRLKQIDSPGSTTRINWQHNQSFSSRTRFDASIDYATSPGIIVQNSVNPSTATATIDSRLNFSKQFGWGTLNVGGTRTQELSRDGVSQTFPTVNFTPSPVNITPSITWSTEFSFTNTQTFHTAAGTLPVPGDSLGDSLFVDDRATLLSFRPRLRVGSWTWENNVTVRDRISNLRQEFLIPDSTAPGGRRRVLYGQTFETTVDWGEPRISLPSLLTGTWKLQPAVSIANATAGPFMVRNQFTGGRFVRQGKRLAFSASLSPTFFGFFPGMGPLQRIRHSVSPIVSYAYAPSVEVPLDYARAVDPTGTKPEVRTDPQQTITFGLSQNFEAKLKPPAGDTTEREPRKIRLLSISTTSIGYNFEQAKQAGRTGWTTQTLSNGFASDLLPGFRFDMTHDLWDGTVGFDTTKFSPFLTSVNASFSVTPATLRGLASLVGLRRREAPSPAAPPPGPQGGGGGGGIGLTGFPGQGGLPTGGPRMGGAGREFSLGARYSSTRTRPKAGTPQAVTGQGGLQQLSLDLKFAPTRHWSASWSSVYDVDTRQFGQHALSLERDLNRWHASFSFLKSPTGSFAFSFYIALLDQPDIKFDYQQQTLTR